MQITNSSDPYIIFSCGQSSATTSWKLQTLEPRWDESFNLWILNKPGIDNLKVDVRDKDLFSSDDDLGTAYVCLKDLEAGKETVMEIPLKGPNSGQGVVTIVVTYLPFCGDSQRVILYLHPPHS